MNHNATPDQKRTESAPNWEAIARALWGLLDDIDTAGDMFKPERQAHERYVQAKANKRNDYMHSPDGYALVPTAPGAAT